MSREWDVIIVGAGPVGGRVATHLAKGGISVLLLEEHSELGRPFQCAGLVTPNAMHEVELYQTVLAEVDGAKIHSPGGILVPVGKEGEMRTYVVCRKRFDQGVVQQSIEAGASIWLNSKPTDAYLDGERMIVEVDKQGTSHQLSCKLLIGCDGAHSWTRRHFKLGRPKELMIGFQAEVTGYQAPNNWLEMYSGEEVGPGFFAWVIPSGFGTHRIGLWSNADHLDGRSVEQCYDTLLTHPLWKERFANVKEVARYCGPIPSGMLKKPVAERVMVIGDAAGMAKPTTGGGIGPGFKLIACISEDLIAAIKADKLSEKTLQSMTNSKWNAMRKEQDRARALRELLGSNCSDE